MKRIRGKVGEKTNVDFICKEFPCLNSRLWELKLPFRKDDLSGQYFYGKFISPMDGHAPLKKIPLRLISA